jgi:parvulin-like peptidyl-prolyl isomerase
VEEAAFRLPVGAVSDPIVVANGAAVLKLVAKQEATPAEFAAAKDKFRDEVLADRRNRFFGAYMAKAKQRMKIEVNRETLQKAVS